MTYDLQIRGIERMTHFSDRNTITPAAGTQGYTNWVVRERQEAEAMEGNNARNTVDSCEALMVSVRRRRFLVWLVWPTLTKVILSINGCVW